MTILKIMYVLFLIFNAAVYIHLIVLKKSGYLFPFNEKFKIMNKVKVIAKFLIYHFYLVSGLWVIAFIWHWAKKDIFD